MKVIHQSQEALEFKIRPPWETAIAFFFIALIMMGFLNGGRELVVEKSANGVVTASHAWPYLGIPWGKQSLRGVTRVYVDHLPSNPHKIRIHVESKDGRFHTTDGHGSNSTTVSARMLESYWASIADQCNQVIHQPGPGRFVYKTTGFLMGFLIASFIFLVFVWNLNQRYWGRLDRTSDTFHLKQWIVFRLTERKIKLDQVKEFKVLKVGYQAYYIAAFTASMGQIRMGRPGPGFKIRNHLVDTLNAFLQQAQTSRSGQELAAGDPIRRCIICGESEEGMPRFSDDHGQYYHQSCYDAHYNDNQPSA